jgi:hypothetical protein
MNGNITDVSISGGGNDGSIDVTATGGTSPYDYLWNNGAITEDLSGLSAGTYTVTVIDAHGCSNGQSFAVGPLAVGGVTSSVETIFTSVSLYPNPASYQFVIAIEADGNTIKRMSIEIVNMVGQIIYATQPEAFNGSLKKQIDVSGITNGAYTIWVTIDGKDFFNQLLIQH